MALQLIDTIPIPPTGSTIYLSPCMVTTEGRSTTCDYQSWSFSEPQGAAQPTASIFRRAMNFFFGTVDESSATKRRIDTISLESTNGSTPYPPVWKNTCCDYQIKLLEKEDAAASSANKLAPFISAFLDSPVFLTSTAAVLFPLGAYQIFPTAPSTLITITTTITIIAIRVLIKKNPLFQSRIYHELGLGGLKILNIYRPNSIHWWDRITDSITLGALPITHEQLIEIKEIADAVLSIVEPLEMKGIGFFGDPITKKDLKQAGIKHKLISVRDTEPLLLEQIHEGVTFIRSQILQGKKVYVNCKGGRGRSTSIVVSYLIRFEELDFETAYKKVENKRPLVRMNRRQKDAVKVYERSLLKSDTGLRLQ